MALSHQIGSVGGQFIAICILLFAFSSIVGNYSYCETNLFFISKNKTYLQLYRIIVGNGHVRINRRPRSLYGILLIYSWQSWL